MRKYITAAALFSLSTTAICTSTVAQTVTSDHKPNRYTVVCLEAPTRDCAFNAALQTVIAEEFGIERAKVLIGVARAMIATGQGDKAQETLMLALEEARSVRLSLVTQEKITEVAPLLARAGDVAGALALTEELQNDSIRDIVLLNIAEEAAMLGSVADMRVALGQLGNQGRAFWRELVLLTKIPRTSLASLDLAAVEARVRGFERPDQLYRGLVLLAVVADRKGEPGDRNAYLAEADEVFSGVIGINQRAFAAADRARFMFDAGMDDAFINTSYELALLHGDRLRDAEMIADFSQKVGVIEAGTGNLEEALKRVRLFGNIDDKARYVASLRGGRDKLQLAAEVRDVMGEVAEIDGAYERDLVRLTLLEGAVANEDVMLSRQIIEAIEDDDNQAYGLALMAPMLQ